MCLRSNGNMHTIKCRICNEVERKINCLLLDGILFESMHVTKKLTRILELMWREGIGITSKCVSIRTKNCILCTIVKVLLPKLQLKLQERKQKRLCNLPQSCICYNNNVPCWNMKEWGLFVWALGSPKKIAKNIKLITLVEQW
jgi:hypothetical protein